MKGPGCRLALSWLLISNLLSHLSLLWNKQNASWTHFVLLVFWGVCENNMELMCFWESKNKFDLLNLNFLLFMTELLPPFKGWKVPTLIVSTCFHMLHFCQSDDMCCGADQNKYIQACLLLPIAAQDSLLHNLCRSILGEITVSEFYHFS